jgi:hypothetical protein
MADLLSSRPFVTDMARLAEGLVMQDMHQAFWDFDAASSVASVQAGLGCREHPAFPDKCGDVVALPESEAASCEVRRRRAAWALQLRERYAPRMVEWIDSGEGCEKAVAVLTLELAPGRRLLVVCFRGSKALQDYTKTDVSFWFTPVSPALLRADIGLTAAQPAAAPATASATTSAASAASAASASATASTAAADAAAAATAAAATAAAATAAAATAAAATAAAATAAAATAAGGASTADGASLGVDAEGASAFLTHLAASSVPCATVGLWRAYAGGRPRAARGLGPRARVRQCVEQALAEAAAQSQAQGEAGEGRPKRAASLELLVTGHSLGGGLATLCAYDLTLALARTLTLTLTLTRRPRHPVRPAA